MELQLTAAQNEWRAEVTDFLDTELPARWEKSTEWCEDEDFWAFAIAFTRKVSARGWIGLTWPKEYGGLARPPVDQLIFSEEFTYRDAPLVNTIGWGLAAGALLRGGTQAQKQKFLPAIQRTEVLWAEGYTEPEAGSDLASLSTRAVRDGDEWVISGQKTFTTWGTHADMLYCAARTDPDAPRHRGITIFGLPIDQPGVSFGPLLNIGGGRQNHTFLDGARVPHENMIGQEGRGWDLIMGGFYGGNIGAAYMDAQQKLDKMVAYCKTARRNGKPLIEDAVVRDQLAEMDLLVQAERLLTYESLSNIQSKRPPAFAGAIGAVVTPGASGITLALVDVAAPGVELTKLPNLAGYPLYAATFDQVHIGPQTVLGPVHGGWELLEPILDRAAVLRAAQIQGAAERLLELSVDYAERRTQFGQAIGRYQAVQYLCSDIAINSHLTSLMVRYAAGLLDAGLPAGKAVSQAKAQASLTARLAPERAHAVHAGIAFILDFDVQLFTRRCRHWELDIGDERYHRERIAAALAAALAA